MMRVTIALIASIVLVISSTTTGYVMLKLIEAQSERINIMSERITVLEARLKMVHDRVDEWQP